VIAIVDYGMGNLRSVLNAFERVAPGAARVVSAPEDVLAADRVVVPGVGAFRDAIGALRARGLAQALREAAAGGKPLLGVCLGMQLLATRSHEFGDHEGLDLIAGTVELLRTEPGLRIPHVGWNDLEIRAPADPLLGALGPEPAFYFVHSYEFRPDDPAAVTAVTDYGRPVTACVGAGNVFGVQFHPEKSGDDGLVLLGAFATC
jgi:imidazole glycerol-phosphate synthase subunit HisH